MILFQLIANGLRRLGYATADTAEQVSPGVYKLQVQRKGKQGEIYILTRETNGALPTSVIDLTGKYRGEKMPPTVVETIAVYAGLRSEDLAFLTRQRLYGVKVGSPSQLNPKIREYTAGGEIIAQIPLLYPLLLFDIEYKEKRGIFRRKVRTIKGQVLLDPSSLSFCNITNSLVCEKEERNIPHIPVDDMKKLRNLRGKVVTPKLLTKLGIKEETALKIIDELVASGVAEPVGKGARLTGLSPPITEVSRYLATEIDVEWGTILPPPCLNATSMESLVMRGLTFMNLILPPKNHSILLYPFIALSVLKRNSYSILAIDGLTGGVNKYLKEKVSRAWDCLRKSPVYPAVMRLLY